MKKYISLLALLPLYISAMDGQNGVFQPPATHITSDLIIQKNIHSFHGEAQSSAFVDNTGTDKCLIYGTCCMTTMATGAAAGCVAHATNNVSLGEWICLTGTSFACYRCNSALKHNRHIRAEHEEAENQQRQRVPKNAALPLLIMVGQPADHTQGDLYNFSYVER